MDQVPTIDIAPLFSGTGRTECVAEIGRACREIGFLSISGTGVDPELAPALREEIRALFDLPEERKFAGAITRDNYRGFIPFGLFTANDGTGKADNYEGFKLHWECAPDDPVVAECPLYGPNLWPEELPNLRDLTLQYWAELDRVSGALLGAIEESLGLDSGAITSLFEKPMTNMTMLHYPPQAPDEKGFGIHPHKDTDALTIISPDPVGGLEVITKGGGWHEVSCPEGGFVVNIGDMLELWSGGQLVSTPHRVINRSGKDRISFPFFMVPRHDVVVKPLVPAREGFDRPEVHTGHWSAETWRTNWPDEVADEDTPELGTIHA